MWYARDERARDREVLHLQSGACFINPASTHGKLCVLPREACTVSTGVIGYAPRESYERGNPETRYGETSVTLFGLRGEQSTLTVVQESAEGIVGTRQARRVRHSRAERWRNREAAPQRLLLKARTVKGQ